MVAIKNPLGKLWLMVAVMMLAAGLALSLLLWQQHKAMYYARLDYEYHSGIADQCLLIVAELGAVQRWAENSVGLVDEGHEEANIPYHALYVISQAAERIEKSQKNFGDDRFQGPTKRLLDTLSALGLSAETASSTELLASYSLDTSQKAVRLAEQLQRLHKVSKLTIQGQSRRENSQNTRYVLVLLFVCFFGSGTVIYRLVASIRDAWSEQYSLQERLWEEKELSTTTLQSIGDAVITTDHEGNVTGLNPVAENLTGWTSEDARGRSVKEVFPIIDAKTRETIANPVERVLATGETVYLSNSTTLVGKTGTEFQIADSAAPIRKDADGPLLGMVLVFNDVTESYRLREAVIQREQELQGIMDHSPAAMAVFELSGTLRYANREFVQRFGGADQEDLSGGVPGSLPQAVFDFISDARRESVDGGVVFESELTLASNEEDHPSFFFATSFPMRNKEGKIDGFGISLSDITERQKQADQLRQALKMDALGKLTGGIAHDYNNMLGIILGYADLLKHNLDNKKKTLVFADEIATAAKRGAKLTRKLLDFSRHRSNDNTVVLLQDVLESQEHMLRRTLTARIELTIDCDADLWPVVLDVAEFENAVINMAINAMHAIEGSGELKIVCRNIPATESVTGMGDCVRVEISDNGPGMDEKTLTKVFDPFFTTKGTEGTGLGLSQVYGFVERARGHISVRSIQGKGTCFVLEFPRYFSGEKQDVPCVDREEPALAVSGASVLLVDDEPAMLSLGRELLSEQGYRVYVADSADRAWDILQRTEVDVMITDVIMPEMDGYALAAKVREHFPRVRIQLVSGFHDTIRAEGEGSDLRKNMLNKPYSPELLLERVQKLVPGKD